MSIKIVVSYIHAAEKKLILKLLKPLLDADYRYKDKKGSPHNHLYIQHKGRKRAEKDNENDN